MRLVDDDQVPVHLLEAGQDVLALGEVERGDDLLVEGEIGRADDEDAFDQAAQLEEVFAGGFELVRQRIDARDGQPEAGIELVMVRFEMSSVPSTTRRNCLEC